MYKKLFTNYRLAIIGCLFLFITGFSIVESKECIHNGNHLCNACEQKLEGCTEMVVRYKCKECGLWSRNSKGIIPKYCNNCSCKINKCMECGQDLEFE